MNKLLPLKKESYEIEILVAIVSLLIAILLMSFAGIFIKLSEFDISPNATVFNRLWIGALALGMWHVTKGVYINLKPDKQPKANPDITSFSNKKMLFFLILIGVAYVAFQSTWAWSLTQTSVTISTVLHNMTPVFTSLGAWLIFRQRFDRIFLMGMVLALGGVVAIGLEDWQIATGKIEGDFAALISAIFYGGYILSLEQLRSRLNATIILMWSSLIGSAIVLPILLITQDKIFPSSWQGWLAVIYLAIICQAVGQGLLAYSLKKLSASFVALVIAIEPVISAIEAWIIFSERLSLFSWIAFCIVLLGIYITLYSKSIVKQN